MSQHVLLAFVAAKVSPKEVPGADINNFGTLAVPWYFAKGHPFGANVRMYWNLVKSDPHVFSFTGIRLALQRTAFAPHYQELLPTKVKC